MAATFGFRNLEGQHEPSTSKCGIHKKTSGSNFEVWVLKRKLTYPISKFGSWTKTNTSALWQLGFDSIDSLSPSIDSLNRFCFDLLINSLSWIRCCFVLQLVPWVCSYVVWAFDYFPRVGPGAVLSFNWFPESVQIWFWHLINPRNWIICCFVL